MTHAAGSAPAYDVQQIANQTAELTARRMMDEFRKEFAPTIQVVAAMKPIVLGNGVKPLSEQFADLRDHCGEEHSVLHKRITDDRVAGKGQREGLRGRMRGWFEALSSAGGVIAFLITIYYWFNGGHH